MGARKHRFQTWRSLFGMIASTLIAISCGVLLYFFHDFYTVWVVLLSIVLGFVLLFGLLFFLMRFQREWHSDWGVGNNKLEFGWDDVHITATLRVIHGGRYNFEGPTLLIIFHFADRFFDDKADIKASKDKLIIVAVNYHHIKQILHYYNKPIRTIHDDNFVPQTRWKHLKLILEHNRKCLQTQQICGKVC